MKILLISHCLPSARNCLLISPDALVEDGLLLAGDCEGRSFPVDVVDFDAVTTFKRGLIGAARNHYRRGARSDLRDAYHEFAQAKWLDDYALFRALKTRYNGAYYKGGHAV
jgi:4-alpha-glucanotransferase